MPILHNATGRSRPLECKAFGSFTGAVKSLRAGYGGVAAGDHGCISVWRTDKGELYADFWRHNVTLDARKLPSLTALRSWLKEWTPKLHTSSR